VNVDLPWPAFLPRDYVPGQKLRIEVYRRLARLRNFKKLDDFRQELRDRYGTIRRGGSDSASQETEGAFPEPVEWLLRTTEVRLLCVNWQIAGIHRDGKDLIFSYRNAKKIAELASLSRVRLKVVDEKSAYLRLKPEDGDSPEDLYRLLLGVLNPTKLG
jgi:transcription-repair coupling factor (superfamily II helicase)